MIKSEIVAHMLAKLPNISEKDLSNAVNHILKKIEFALASGERIEIRSFGNFSLRYHPARKAHNPKTGEHLVTPPKHSPYFKPGKKMRKRINDSQHIVIKTEDE